MRKTYPFAALLILGAFALILLTALQPNRRETVTRGSALSVMENYHEGIEGRFDRMIFGDSAARKDYRIPDTALSAPVPDQTCFGEADSPAELEWLVNMAADLLDGQKLYFNTDIELYPFSNVRYYLDDSILAITWQESVLQTTFTYSEIKLLHPSQFRRFLSGGAYGSGILSLTTEMAQTVNAVVATSADYYAYRRPGITVTNGVVNKAVPGVSDTCFIDRNGDLILERDLPFDTEADVQEFVSAHDINFSLSFGPILVKDGAFVCPWGYNLGEVNDGYPRAALCQMGKLHYLVIMSNMGPLNYNQLEMRDFAKAVAATGCEQAYAMDGGQTATVVMNNELINQVNYGSQRLISDIIYFATAIDTGG